MSRDPVTKVARLDKLCETIIQKLKPKDLGMSVCDVHKALRAFELNDDFRVTETEFVRVFKRAR